MRLSHHSIKNNASFLHFPQTKGHLQRSVAAGTVYLEAYLCQRRPAIMSLTLCWFSHNLLVSLCFLPFPVFNFSIFAKIGGCNKDKNTERAVMVMLIFLNCLLPIGTDGDNLTWFLPASMRKPCNIFRAPNSISSKSPGEFTYISTSIFCQTWLLLHLKPPALPDTSVNFFYINKKTLQCLHLVELFLPRWESSNQSLVPLWVWLFNFNYFVNSFILWILAKINDTSLASLVL